MVALGFAACEDTITSPPVFGPFAAPETVNLGQVLVGGQSQETVLLSNQGSAAGRISSLSVSGDPAFEATLFGDDMLQPGEAREAIRVVYSPIGPTPGARGLLEVDVTGPRGVSENILVELEASALPSALELTPFVLDFGSLLPGSQTSSTALVTNLTDETLDVSLSLISDRGAFSIPEPAEFAIPPNGQRPIEVDLFMPVDLTSASLEAELEASTLDSTSSRTRIVARVLRQPIDCDDLDLGLVDIDEPLIFDVTCRNIARRAVEVSGFSPSGQFEGQWSVATPLPVTFQAQSSQTLRFVYQGLEGPGAEDIEAVQSLTVSDPLQRLDFSDARVVLRARWGRPSLEWQPKSYDFEAVRLGTRSRRLFELRNRGQRIATGIELELPGEEFTIEVPPPRELNAGGRAVVEISFTPADAGPKQTTLLAIAEDGVAANAAISGTGVDKPACSGLEFSTDELPFGLLERGEKRSIPITFRNTGATDCDLGPFYSDAFDRSVFGFEDRQVRLSSGETHSVEVANSTTAVEGDYQERLLAYVSDGRQLEIDLSVESRAARTLDPTTFFFLEPYILADPPTISLDPLPASCGQASAPAAVGFYWTRDDVGLARGDFRGASAGGPDGSSLTLTGLPPSGTATELDRSTNVEFTIHVDHDPTELFHAWVRLSDELDNDRIIHIYRTEAATPPLSKTREVFTRNPNPKLDLLFVHTARFKSNGPEIAPEVSRLLEALDQSNINTRFGVLSATIGPLCNEKLYQAPSDVPLPTDGTCSFLGEAEFLPGQRGRFLDVNRVPDVSLFVEQLLPGDASVASIFSREIYFALSPPRIDDWNSDFLRDDAALLVVGGFASIPFETKSQAKAARARALSTIGGRRRDVGIAQFIDRKLGGGLPGIVCSEEEDIRSSSAGLEEFTTGVGGFPLYRVECERDWVADLLDGGLPVNGYRTRFPLKSRPRQGSLEVVVDGTTLGSDDYELLTSSNSLVIPRASWPSSVLDEVRITYESTCELVNP